MTQEWRAIIDLPKPADATAARLAKLARALPGYGIVTTNDVRIRAEMTVQARTLRQATDAALRATSDATDVFKGPPIGPVAIRVLTVDEHLAELANPELDVVGLKEAAEFLGVSPQRVDQLRKRPDFPDGAELAQGTVWTRASLERFNEGWDRRPGRPRKAPTAGHDQAQR
jgi:hypothetical protein